ncbi:MAG: class I SAM-dependent methyltransferase [Alicyclobacillus sp.]|nr:class I SAM-dependent methyltransferase [Alicyclobacillus sp.]
MDYQDVLAAVGAGGAHPGGMDATYRWLEEISWSPSMRVLEVGCGTGRTLLEIQRRFGCQVTGVDIRREMIRKAKLRAKQTGCPARWVIASAERLPLPDASFDLVFTESVNVFCRAEAALREYYRVLCPGGVYVDVEMLLLSPVSEEWKETVRRLYGAVEVPDLAGWRRLFRGAGFSEVRVLMTRAVRPEDAMTADQAHPDPVNLATPGAYRDTRVLEVLEANARWMETHHRPLGYGVFMCRKSEG